MESPNNVQRVAIIMAGGSGVAQSAPSLLVCVECDFRITGRSHQVSRTTGDSPRRIGRHWDFPA